MIKDLDQGKRILEKIDAFIKQSEVMKHLIEVGDYQELDMVGGQFLSELQKMFIEVENLKKEEPTLVIDIMCESIIDSLRRIVRLARARSTKVADKVEFELIPLLEEMYVHFYYRGCIYPDPQKTKQYLSCEKPKYYTNKYLEKAKETGDYRYDLSIVVVAYNKLDLTRQCVETILEYTPKNLKYELVLLNHGSTDGTKEYFESIGGTKQLDILKNGAGIHTVRRILEGKYQLMVSNDVLITPNAIANMIKCMESDEKIQLVVPSTPNISNLQTIEAAYTNADEMFEFARKNNVSDSRRWEQRTRLCDPIALTKDVWNILAHNPYFDNWLSFSFPDDRTSLVLRRAGYKMMLAKDAYCYHFGSMTLANEIGGYKDDKGNEGAQAFYQLGRQEFYKECGVDPWGIGMCWNFELINLLPWNKKGHINILGINCGLGSDPLKIKEYIKELNDNLDVTIYNVTDDIRYMLDLKGVSDQFKLLPSINKGQKIWEDTKFDYILFEDKLEQYLDAVELIVDLVENTLKKKGVIAFVLTNPVLRFKLKEKYPRIKETPTWCMITK